MNSLFLSFDSQDHEPGDYRALPSFRLSLLASLSSRQVETRLAERFDLRLHEARVIGAVGTFGALSLKDLCQEAHVEKSYASKLIGRLVERALVEKVGDSKDQRAISVRLSAAGKDLHRAMYEDLREHNVQWLSVLEDSERDITLRTLEKLIVHTRDLQARKNAPTVNIQVLQKEVVPLDLEVARQLHRVLGELIDQAQPPKEQESQP